MIKRFTKFRSNITMCLSFPLFPSPYLSPAVSPVSPQSLPVSTSVLICFHHPVSPSDLPSVAIPVPPRSFSPSLSFTLSLSLCLSRSMPFCLPLGLPLCLSLYLSLPIPLFPSLSLSSLPSYASLSPSLSLGLSLSVPSSHRLNPYLLVAYPASR